MRKKYIHYKYVPKDKKREPNGNLLHAVLRLQIAPCSSCATSRLNGNISLITSMKAISTVFVELQNPSWTRNS